MLRIWKYLYHNCNGPKPQLEISEITIGNFRNYNWKFPKLQLEISEITIVFGLAFPNC